MSKGYKRHFLKVKEVKTLLEEASKKLKIELDKILSPEAKVELIKTSFGETFLINGKPCLFKLGQNLYPTLLFEEALALMPKVVVDMGAISHICNGADVMAPGIISFEGAFNKGDLVVVVDEKYSKPLVIGEILYKDDETVNIKRGVVVKNIHFVGDKIWKTLKEMS
ncbi:MAG: DUF1947 domain-containing protein [Candidatus Bathyarchaeia archaeon]|nr:DUF1947 domain-containing protein [Candidatus Bathyarchaeota archaeon]